MSRAAKGADCKSAGYAFVGSSPTSPTTLIFQSLIELPAASVQSFHVADLRMDVIDDDQRSPGELHSNNRAKAAAELERLSLCQIAGAYMEAIMLIKSLASAAALSLILSPVAFAQTGTSGTGAAGTPPTATQTDSTNRGMQPGTSASPNPAGAPPSGPAAKGGGMEGNGVSGNGANGGGGR